MRQILEAAELGKSPVKQRGFKGLSGLALGLIALSGCSDGGGGGAGNTAGSAGVNTAGSTGGNSTGGNSSGGNAVNPVVDGGAGDSGVLTDGGLAGSGGGRCDTGCLISGSCVKAGESDPLNPCMSCNPSIATDAYSALSDGSSCGDGLSCQAAACRCDIGSANPMCAVCNSDVTGGTAAFSTYQPYLGINHIVALNGVFATDASEEIGLGEVSLFAGNFAPGGYELANGQLLTISTNSPLFSLLGTTYGGDGRTTFALPDLQGRSMVVASDSSQSPYHLGSKYGAEEHNLSNAEMPSHYHELSDGWLTGSSGGDTVMTLSQPSLAIRARLQLVGLFPSGSYPSNGFISQVKWFSGVSNTSSGSVALDGSLFNISDHTAAFSVMGTTYGGDGSTTFASPNAVGRFLLGTGQGAGLSNRETGSRFGTSDTALSLEQLATHDHGYGSAADVTTSTGGSSPISLMQESLALRYYINIVGLFPSHGGSLASADLLGQIVLSAAANKPAGWAECAGQLLPINQHSALFSILGTTYGGNGRTTFALPDLRGRIPVHPGTGAGLSTVRLGQIGGSESMTLTQSLLPAHSHGLPTSFCP